MINTINKTKKILGKGMNGIVYLATDNNNNQYALKIQQIMPNNLKKDFSSLMWREIYFANVMNKKYPNHFMQLFDYNFDENCNYHHSFNGFHFKLEDLPKNQQTYYKKLFASPYCCIKLWSFVDTTLHNLLNTWKTFYYDIYFDFVIQIIYIIYLINKEGFFHNDLHQKNIGLKKTNIKYITIFNKNIPTHGYFIQAIDFELNLHKKYKLKNWEKIKLANDNDIFTLLNLALFDFADFIHFYKNIKINVFQKFIISNDDEKLLSPLLPNDILTKENHHFLINILYKLLFYEKYQKNLLGNKFTKSIPPKFYIPLDCILFIIKHIYYPEKILKFLITYKKN